MCELWISNTVREEAKLCPNDRQCLETGQCGDREECQVWYADGENMLFLASRACVECPYRITWAGYAVCRCPVHYALVKQNGKHALNKPDESRVVRKIYPLVAMEQETASG